MRLEWEVLMSRFLLIVCSAIARQSELRAEFWIAEGQVDRCLQVGLVGANAGMVGLA